MKKLLLSISIALISGMVFGQFGGGLGTEEDPYRIYTKEHFEEFATEFNSHNELNFGDFTGIHLRLMNDITDTVKIMPSSYTGDSESYLFNGSFHGGGHSINIFPDSTETCSVFGIIGENGYLDSLQIVGKPYFFNSMVYANYGTIYNCICNIIIEPPLVSVNGYRVGICNLNSGLIDRCINLTDFSNSYIPGTDLLDAYYLAGISLAIQGGVIKNCINMGNFSAKNVISVAGIICWSDYDGTIENCINYGNISVQNTIYEWACDIGGIAGIAQTHSVIQNCINMGNIDFLAEMPAGGIACIVYSDGGEVPIINCLNVGKVNGIITFNNQNTNGGGGILGRFDAMELLNTCSNCLNIGNTIGNAIVDSVTHDNSVLASNNYYDKQMCLSKGIADEDIPDSAEGKLTTQLTGTSSELQAMLGDGWSYAEGRYPIPQGLENDSLALVATTPVYLHFETEEAYNHVDSVNKNFTVGLENNVSWYETNGRVSFSDEDVTLLSIGMETLTVSLGDYCKKVRINIVDTETAAPTQTIENGMTLYPNPASDFINLNLNGTTANKMEICDITGKLLSSQIIATEHSQIHIGNLKSGMYLLKIYNKNLNVTTLRFAKD